MVILLILVLRIGLAFIPASIASEKGYSFGGYYLFGILTFLPALFVALFAIDLPLLMNEISKQVHDEAARGATNSTSKLEASNEGVQIEVANARNCYTNIPFRPTRASIRTDTEGRAVCSIHFKTYVNIEMDALILHLVLLDEFEIKAFNQERTVRNICKTDSGFFCTVLLTGICRSDLGKIRCFEAYIKAVSKDGVPNWFADVTAVSAPLALNLLSDCKNTYGSDAFALYTERGESWTCVCGFESNCGESCHICARSRQENTEPDVQKNSIRAFLCEMERSQTIEDVLAAFQSLQDELPADVFHEGDNYLKKRREISSLYGLSNQIVKKDFDKMKELLL